MLKGQLVELRPIAKEDLKNHYKWGNDEEVANLAAGSSSAFYNNVSMEELEMHYDKEMKALDRKTAYSFSIYTLEGEQHIGNCGYREVNWITRCATLGISIGEKSCWNNGYGTDALKTLVHHLFNSMNLNRIQLDTWSGNERAIKAYKKCGFVIEGRLRNNEYVNGQFYDTILMGLLREDYSG